MVQWVYKPSYNWGVPLICRVSFSILFVQFREALSWKIMVNVPTRYGLKLNPSKRGFQQLSRILLIIVGQTSVPKKEIVRIIQITSYFILFLCINPRRKPGYRESPLFAFATDRCGAPLPLAVVPIGPADATCRVSSGRDARLGSPRDGPGRAGSP